jgi:hypothetical protein
MHAPPVTANEFRFGRVATADSAPPPQIAPAQNPGG